MSCLADSRKKECSRAERTIKNWQLNLDVLRSLYFLDKFGINLSLLFFLETFSECVEDINYRGDIHNHGSSFSIHSLRSPISYIYHPKVRGFLYSFGSLYFFGRQEDSFLHIIDFEE